MLFNSFSYLVFFPIVTILYFVLPHRFRWLLLLVASCIFYMAFIPIYVVILGATIIVDYFAGRLIESATGEKRKLYLLISILANVSVLAVFKYYNFALANVEALAHFLHWNLSLPMLKMLLPIGLSFHTFQAMSYTIEVYRGNQPAERHFGIYALYVMFFPQLVAGPIERPQNLLPQFHQKHSFNFERLAQGLQLILWGLFKKVVIADRAAVFVDTVFNQPGNFQGLSIVVAIVLFSFQIYCDFSGYSDIAIGSAQVLGINLMKNFDKPYFSSSIAEFWRRWHISLSTWFKDYVYIPLGGSRAGQAKWTRNIAIIFLLSGLWHGANWTFVIWGALHASYIIIGGFTTQWREKLAAWVHFDRWPVVRQIWQVVATFSLASFAWIFFRASSIGEALLIIKQLVVGLPASFTSFNTAQLLLGQSQSRAALTVAAIVALLGLHLLDRQGKLRSWLESKSAFVRWPAYSLLLWVIIFFGQVGAKQFIYFVF